MKVIFAIPALPGTLQMECALSLMQTQRILDLKGIPHELFTLCQCGSINTARNTLVAMFLADAEATDLFFIDSDVGFDPAAVVKILERSESIVAGIYPLKRDEGGFPVRLKTKDGVPLGRDGLIEAIFLPAGFMRIKRGVFDLLAESYPELKYEESVIEVDSGAGQEAFDFFGMGAFGRRFRTEDYAFCQRWRDINGTLWVYPNIDFQHIGSKSYKGNYHEHLLRLPGGAKDLTRLVPYAELPGWMNLEELEWLVEQASQHQRIVELGSHLGRSTLALAENTEGKVWAIDLWKPWRDNSLTSSTDLYEKFCANLKDAISSGKVTPIVSDHAETENFPPEWLTGPNDLKPDMVFVDGDHSYEAVRRDIETWRHRLAPGGLLCGHDYDWPSVGRAVKEAFPEVQVVPSTSIWFYPIPTGAT
jgi:predicted O-methyltransferase YrrM